MKKLGFNIALMGMIASGKETQTNILRKMYALKPIETGVYTRNLLKEKSKNGAWARRTAGKGNPLPVVLMKKFIINELRNKPKDKDFIFIGGPRLKPEAQLVKKIFEEKREDLLVLYLTLPDKEVYKRSLERKIGNMKSIYKIWDNKKDIATRIKWHKDQVGKTVKYFEKLGILKKINGNQSITGTTKDILKVIKEHKKELEK